MSTTVPSETAKIVVLKFPQTLYEVVNLEFYILIAVLALSTYLFYKFFLGRVSQERHQSIQNQCKNIFYHMTLFTVLYVLYEVFGYADTSETVALRILPYIASFSFISGVVVIIKSLRLFTLQYLFLGSMSAGVPLLLVNIFSLAVTTAIFFWTLSRIFLIDLTPVLATSAAFSIILGLALQDTLGNLFAGISIQVDKTFGLGDWLEVQNGSVKIVGQVKELSWRSTLLVGWTDELITIPNKVMASSQVSNFSPYKTPIVRSQTFFLKVNSDFNKVKDLLELGASQISDVCGIPSPLAFVRDIKDSWIEVKVVYYIKNYGSQYLIGDKVITACLNLLKQNGIETAHQVVSYKSDSEKAPYETR